MVVTISPQVTRLLPIGVDLTQLLPITFGKFKPT